MAKFEIGFIGCGGIARHHAEGLAALRESHLCAFSDIVLENAKRFAADFHGRAYQDYHEMLDKERLDAVWICIPPFAHTDQELLCVEKNIPFFVEKPVALTMEKAREVNAAIKKKRLLTQVGYSMRFRKPLIEVRRLVKEEGGPIGLVKTVRLGWWEPGMKGWLTDVTKSGGQLVENITHQVDTMRWVAGDVNRVYAEFDTRLWDSPLFTIEDVSVTTLRFESGAVGVISGSTRAHSGRILMTIIARNLQVDLGRDGIFVTRRRDGRPEKTNLAEPRHRRSGAPPVASPIDVHFIDSVKKGELIRKDIADYEEGMKTLEVTLAAGVSAKTHKPVSLPIG